MVQALGAGHHHGELLEAHVGWLPLGDVDDEVTTTRASAPGEIGGGRHQRNLVRWRQAGDWASNKNG